MRPFFLVMLLAFSACLYAQPINPSGKFVTLPKLGLTEIGAVTCVYQDKSGFMWIGTHDGLLRYDGAKVKWFEATPNKPTGGLPKGAVNKIIQSRDGSLWIGTANGLFRYSFVSNDFTPFTLYDNQSNNIQALVEDKKGSIWVNVTGKNELISLTKNGNLFLADTLNFGKTKPSIEFPVSDLKCAPWGNLLVSFYKGGVAEVLSATKINYHVYQEGNAAGLSYKGVQNLALSSGGRFYSSNLAGVDVVDRNSGKLFTIKPPAAFSAYGKILGSLEAGDYLWIASLNGLWRAPIKTLKDTTTYQFFQYDKNNKASINSGYAGAVLNDNENRLWVVTAGGLQVYFDGNEANAFLDSLNNKLSRLKTSTNVQCFGSDNQGWLWVGTSRGLFKVPESLRKLQKHIYYTDSLTKNQTATVLGKTSESNFVYSVLPDGQTIWAGTMDGLIKHDLKTGKNLKVLLANQAVKDHPYLVQKIRKDRTGRIWVASQQGLGLIRNAAKSALQLFQPEKDARNPLTNIVTDFLEDRNGNKWVTTATGIYRFNETSSKFAPLPDINPVKTPKYYTCVIQAANNKIYAGGAGLFEINELTGKHKVYRFGNLASQTVQGVENVNDSTLAIFAQHGIFMFNTNTQQYALFANQTTENIAVAHNGYLIKPGEYLIAGGNASLLWQNLQQNKLYKRPPKPAISELIINYQPVNLRARNINVAIANMQSLVLYPDDKMVHFELASLDYSMQGNVRFAYRIDGFDAKWQVLEPNQRLISFTSLPSGKYELRVKAFYDRLENAGEERVIKLHVLPPFYLTWWCVLLEVFGISALVFLSVRSYFKAKIKREQAKFELRDKLQHERLRISRDLHDNVGAQLAFIVNTLQKNNSQHEQALDVAKNSIGSLRETIWALQDDEISISSLSSRLKQFVLQHTDAPQQQRIRFENHFVNDVKLSPAQSLNAYRILQEAIFNAVKHAGQGNIVCSFSNNEFYVLIATVEDTGKGMDLNKPHDGHYGLKNMQQRSDEIGAEFTIQSKIDDGTRVSLKLPIS